MLIITNEISPGLTLIHDVTDSSQRIKEDV